MQNLLLVIALWTSATAAPVARWDFDAEESSKLAPHGGVHRDQPGPRPPTYPDFSAQNTAAKFDGHGAYFSLADSEAKGNFDFKNGDAITLEAWVLVDDLKSGENVYVIGKGRTGAPQFARDNQNWALRIREMRGQGCVSFLFATPRGAGVAKSDAHWHRWTTTEGFAARSGWHHVAVTYRFGEPDSIRGWIDGKSRPGQWDMGGATKEGPVVDDDAVWIGSSQGGNPGNSFRGSLDAVAVHREVVEDAALQARYRREGVDPLTQPAPEVMPDLGPLPAGQVVAVFLEGLTAHDRWPNLGEPTPKEVARWTTAEFLLPRLPLRYDSWGIRDSWKAPVLVRLAADVKLPAGSHRMLFRSRGLGRLWVDGQLVARTKSIGDSPSGEEPITPVAEPPLPGLRRAEHRQQEAFGEIKIERDGVYRVVVETLAGGKKFRAEPGELVVARAASEGNSFLVLQPVGGDAAPLELTDQAILAALQRVHRTMSGFDDQTRRTAASSQDDFWKSRHLRAREWLATQPAVNLPPAAGHPVDALLKAKVERALAASAQTPPEAARQFHATVLPILRDACFRCHGEKVSGGLRLNSRAAALASGDSESPAVVPGDPAASHLLTRVRSTDAIDRMPPTGEPLTPKQIGILEEWIKSGAPWPAAPVTAADVEFASRIGDESFARRIYLDTVGVIPTETELREFLKDQAPDKRRRLAERLLNDGRWADHWMSYWQDVLAENPTLINASLNTTGPFRWFLYDALRDDKPIDRWVSELVLLRGGAHDGGSAGFGIAADNDAPLAAKGQIIASAFLGVELQCARCHDSPYHSTKQRDLYALAAMFERKPVSVPKTSSVPAAFFEKKLRESLIKVTLKIGEPVAPGWPFAELTGAADDDSLAPWVAHPEDARERLAALLTVPQNGRFARVVVNRVWRRLIGAGIVEPPHDWEGRAPSHPELLDWLARELVEHDYSVKHVARLILTSQLYERAAVGRNLEASPELRFFVAPELRRMTAEQIVDSLYVAAGQPIDVEELTFDPDGRRPADNRLSLGTPRRAWMFASLANERDRPSLNLPRARTVTDVLEAFGWSGSRQNPRTDRETSPNVLQPGVLANGIASLGLTRAARGSGLADAAVETPSPEALAERLFLRFLSRQPKAGERRALVEPLRTGFAERLTPADQIRPPTSLPLLPRVTWSNHLQAEANEIALELERRVRRGPAADPRLVESWREMYEDVIWTLVNSREFVWIP